MSTQPRGRLVASFMTLLLAGSGCPEDAPTADASVDIAGDASGDTTSPDAVFRFGTTRGQALTAAPFPNNLYLLPGGGIDVDLAGDASLNTVLVEAKRMAWQPYLSDRDGFGFTTGIRLFMNAEPDLGSFAGKVRLVDVGTDVELPVQLAWDGYIGALVVFPAWGYSMAPATTYVVAVDTGVTTVDGVAIEAPTAFVETLTDGAAPSDVDAAFAPLRAWLSRSGAAVPVIGTVFTTETVAGYGQALRAMADGYDLTAPSATIRWDEDTGVYETAPLVEGAALDTYFGLPEAPWQFTPTRWWAGHRQDAALLPGGTEYTGGTLHQNIGRVVLGTLRMPALHWTADGSGGIDNTPLQWANGAITTSLDILVPFSLFLCTSHLADPSSVPVALFQHGGGGERVEAIAMANMNCQNNGVATFAMDNPFHGGRQSMALDAADGLVVPVHPDTLNIYTGLKADAPDFMPDYQGDTGGALETVAPLMALPKELDPAVMEGNLISIAAETLIAIRYLREGDWTGLVPDLSFDPDNVFHTSLSFGANFTTAALALSEPGEVKGAIQSVPTAYVLTANILMAPSNAALAGTVVRGVLGSPWELGELSEAGFRDFGLSIVQWLSQRADPLAWARQLGASALPMLSSSNSWDETLTTTAQLTFNNALGYTVYTNAEWTIDPTVVGAAAVVGTPFTGPATGAKGMFYDKDSCHSQLVAPLCVNTYEKVAHPRPKLTTKTVEVSQICALHAQADHFIGSLLAANPGGEIIAPEGTCETFYGP